MTITYRTPRPDEAEAFAALHVQCWREAYADILPPQLLASFSTESRLPMWQARLKDGKLFVAGAYDAAGPAGFIMAGAADAKHVPDQDGHIWAVYISRRAQRQGIGRWLIGLAARHWLAQGGHSLSVGVLAANAPARAFYEALGARLVQTGTYNWDGHALADCIYIYENLPGLAGGA